MQVQHPWLSSASLSIGTGLLASVAYQFMTFLYLRTKLRREFRPYAGEYDEFWRTPNGTPVPTGVIIHLTYSGKTKFKTEAFKMNERFWSGEIFMREEVPVLGEGFYSHIGRDDTGVHSVLYNPEARHFNVSGANTSHPEGLKSFKTVWKRRITRK